MEILCPQRAQSSETLGNTHLKPLAVLSRSSPTPPLSGIILGFGVDLLPSLGQGNRVTVGEGRYRAHKNYSQLPFKTLLSCSHLVPGVGRVHSQ